MPIIVTVNYQSYVVKSQTDALAVVKALSGAVPVRERWDAQGRRGVFEVEDDARSPEVKVQTVLASQLRRAAPPPEEKPIAPKQLDFPGKVHYSE